MVTFNGFHARIWQADLNDIADAVEWPYAGGDGWQGGRHSDIKNIALPFVSRLWALLVEAVADEEDE